MNPILALIDIAAKWSVRPTKDGANTVKLASYDAEDYIEQVDAVLCVKKTSTGYMVEDLVSGYIVEDSSMNAVMRRLSGMKRKVKSGAY